MFLSDEKYRIINNYLNYCTLLNNYFTCSSFSNLMKTTELTASNCIFFLGGHDLEMLEIKKIISSYGFEFKDKNLSWEAKLSDYQNDFSETKINICIELKEDISPPANYHRIDHHNELSNLPASIEQVAELLGVELNWNQNLIAANDKGHKQAMRAIGASEGEIEQIRLLDRQAQGVTQEMENSAELAIKQAKIIGNLTVIKSDYDKFSPIVDRVDFEHLLVYHNDEATYYGNQVENLKITFGDEIKQDKVYFGGSPNGYLGFIKGTFNDKILKNIMDALVPPFSYHAFMFPFKWELLLDGITTFEQRCSLDAFEEKLAFKDSKSKYGEWYRKPFKLDQQLAYNEYNYFYDFVRDVIYDKGDNEKENTFNLKSIIRHYEFNLPNEANFNIKCQFNTYQLNIRKIQLDIYETGVGILSYHLENHQYGGPEDILNINQFGRRIFVGGFALPQSYKNARAKLSANDVKFIDLADELSIDIGNGNVISENFQDCKDFSKFDKAPFFLPKIITHLLTYNVESLDKEDILTTEWTYQPQKAQIWIAPSIDDRMFVHSWYKCDVEKYAEDVGIHFKEINKPKNDYGYYDIDFSSYVESSNFWYKYVYIDHKSGDSVANKSFKDSTIKKATYERWLDYGTLYGITKYSFTMFCTPDAPDYLLSVHETMYLKMAELSLIQRATTLRFSDEVQYVASIKDEIKKTELTRSLYDFHIRFVNKMDFREITPQEQGIELYDMIQHTMRIETQVASLDKEIKELHSYALLLEEKRNNEDEDIKTQKLNLLTYLGVPITLISFFFSIIGFVKDVKLNIHWDKSYPIHLTDNVFLLEILLLVVLGFSGWQLFRLNTEKLKGYIILIFLCLILMAILPFIISFINNP